MAEMTQMNFDLDPLPKKTRKEVFLDEMNQVVPWGELVALIQPHARGAHQALGGRPPFPIESMLRIHGLQLWWNLSDPAMEPTHTNSSRSHHRLLRRARDDGKTGKTVVDKAREVPRTPSAYQ